MLIVLIMGGAIWGIGAMMKTPVQARIIMLALLYVAVLFVQFALPNGHPIRENLGGGPGDWLVLGGAIALILTYRKGLSALKARARQDDPAPQQQGPFSDAELERYARHIALREVGGAGQRRLKDARVLVVGAGGLGSPALLYLAGAGIGTIGLIDDDVVSLSNLQRQVIHTDERGGMPKVFSAEIAMRALNPHITVRPYNRRFDNEIGAEILQDYGLVLDGTDNFVTRQVVNAACVKAGVPLISGAITQWEGQLTLYDPAKGAPCLACVFPKPPAPGQSATCAEAGVVGPLPGIIGTMMALEAIKEITGAGETLGGSMILYDGLTAETRRVKIKRNLNCPVCAGQI